MRLIDADALMKTLTYSPNGIRYKEVDCDNFPITLSIRDIKKMIRESPTIESTGKINAWDIIWEWFLKFKPIQATSTNVSVAMDGQISAVNLIKASFEEYFNKYVDE